MSDTPISNTPSFNTLNYDQPVVPLYISQNLERQLADVREAERSLSEAYLRIREKLKAWNTPTAPTSKQVWDHTEACLDSLIEQRDLLAAGLRLIADGGLNSEWHAECAKTALANLKGDKP